jgi:hypothetical protein
MQAAVGDRFHVRGNIVGQSERTGEIIEVRGAGGEPPYLVRFDDGHTSLVFPWCSLARTPLSSICARRVRRGRGRLSSICEPGPADLLIAMRAHAADSARCPGRRSCR